MPVEKNFICTGSLSLTLQDIQYICVLICFEYIAPHFIIFEANNINPKADEQPYQFSNDR